MTPDMIADAEALFQTGMNSLYAGMPVLFSNVPVKDIDGYYADFHVVAGETFPLNLGIKSKSRNVGLIQIDVFGPKDKGAGEAANRAFAAGKIFRRQVRSITTEGVVTYKDPSLLDMGEVRGKHMQVCRIPYRYDFKG